MSMSFAIVYGAGRVLTDFLRVDKTWFGLDLTGSQLTAIGVILLSLFTLVRFSRKPLPEPEPEPIPIPEAVARGDSITVGESERPTSTDFEPPPEPGPGPRSPERD